MRRILETEGFAVLEAGTGEEALELMKQYPALAVVDVKLPDINGYDLSRRMKEISPYLQLLQVSASFSDPNLRVSGLSGGTDAYLAQPVHPSELVILIRRMLRTAESICDALVPRFADRCRIFLEKSPGGPASFFPVARWDDEGLRAAMTAHTAITTVACQQPF